MFWFIIHDILTAKKPKATVLSTNSMHQNISKAQRSWSLGRIFEWPQFPKLRLVRRPNFSPNFSPLRSVGFCLWLGLGLRPPEAAHRCTSQLSKATIPWSNGSWRRRRPWMRRANTAVASEGDIEGETSWGLGIPSWGCEWRCWWFTDGSTFWWILFYLFGKRVQTFAPMFGVVVCEHNYIVPTLWVGVFLTQGF